MNLRLGKLLMLLAIGVSGFSSSSVCMRQISGRQEKEKAGNGNESI